MPASLASKPWWRRWFGNRSERAARRFLEGKGYRILVRNWTCDLGELDIVALDGDTIVFVEVRSTGTEESERPAQSINRIKQDRLTKLALFFMQQKKLLGRPARFDVLIVVWPADRREPAIEQHVNAFEPTGRFQMFS